MHPKIPRLFHCKNRFWVITESIFKIESLKRCQNDSTNGAVIWYFHHQCVLFELQNTMFECIYLRFKQHLNMILRKLTVKSLHTVKLQGVSDSQPKVDGKFRISLMAFSVFDGLSTVQEQCDIDNFNIVRCDNYHPCRQGQYYILC